MNKSIFYQEWQSVIVLLVLIAIIAGCGPNAGVGTGGTGLFTSSISGKVADGYLYKATVFMDKSNPPNYQLDPGEPFTTTDANGAYTLNIDPADMGKYPVVVLAIAGTTVDTENNPSMTPLTSSYVLSMPAVAFSSTSGSSNFISPMSSLVRELMETGKYGTKQDATTMQNAMNALSTQLGMPGTDIMANYLAADNTTNTTLHTAAQNIATLMGNQMGQVIGTSGTTITVDVNRYRGMMGTIFSNMPSVSGLSAQTGTNPISTMSNLNNTMTTVLSNTPPTVVGQPYKNMSTAFRGMMGGTNTTTGGMK